MTRPPAMSQADKTTVVLAVLRGECTLAGAAAAHGVSAQAVANWRKAFVGAGSEALSPRGVRRATNLTELRLKHLVREVEELKIALAEAHLAARGKPYIRAV